MVSTGTIRAVNPVSLAHVSSVTKIPRFAAPVTPVIRPALLTTQLMGCCPVCAGGDHAGPVGLTGFIPPDYGSLRATPIGFGGGGGGAYGLFKMATSGHGLGKGATGTGAAYYNTRQYSFGLRGMGKGATGTGAAYYNTRQYSFGLRGLGQIDSLNTPTLPSGNISILGTIGAGGATIPGVGTPSTNTNAQVTQMINSLKSWIGSGRNEADVIVPVQNQMIAQSGVITNQFLTGSNPTVSTLQQLYVDVWILAVSFQEFVLQKAFTDRRASGQALNTVMPYWDGSCGYQVPLGFTATPTQFNCMSWGDGTLGGVGQNGMLGALGRAIVNAGGTAPALMDPHAAANSGVPATTAAAAAAPAVGPMSSIQSQLVSAGLPATIGGVNTSTWLLIGLGVLFLSRVKL